MSILSKIWEFFLGPTSSEKGAVSSSHPLDPLAGLEERRTASIKEEPKKPTRTGKTTASKPQATKTKAAGTTKTKTKGTSKSNGSVRHNRKDSRSGK